MVNLEAMISKMKLLLGLLFLIQVIGCGFDLEEESELIPEEGILIVIDADIPLGQCEINIPKEYLSLLEPLNIEEEAFVEFKLQYNRIGTDNKFLFETGPSDIWGEWRQSIGVRNHKDSKLDFKERYDNFKIPEELCKSIIEETMVSVDTSAYDIIIQNRKKEETENSKYIPNVKELRSKIEDFVEQCISNNEFGSSTISVLYITKFKPTCGDEIQNGDETGIDCGGSCAPCPSCSDGQKNQNEVGIDCGGPCRPCLETCLDGIKNQDETRVDCGGSICPECRIKPESLTIKMPGSSYEATKRIRRGVKIIEWEGISGAEETIIEFTKVSKPAYRTTFNIGVDNSFNVKDLRAHSDPDVFNVHVTVKGKDRHGEEIIIAKGNLPRFQIACD